MVTTTEDNIELTLKTHAMFQHPENTQIPAKITNDMSREQMLAILKEVDRRCSQLWDKVGFERRHQLVDYQPLIQQRNAQ